MKYTVLVLISLVAINSVAQENALLLKDGSVMRYSKSKTKKGVASYLLADNSWATATGEIEGYCDIEGRILYNLPLNIGEIQKIIEGKIEVYEGYEYGAPGAPTPGSYGPTPGGRHLVQYAKKDGQFYRFRNGKEKGKAVLDSLISDAPKKIEVPDDEFHYSDQELLDYIRQYNLQFFQNPDVTAYSKIASMQIYAIVNSKAISEVIVNDSLRYSVPKDYPLTISLPTSTPSKICVVTPSDQYCSLIASSPCTVKFLGIKLNEKKGRIEFENSTRSRMQKFFLSKKALPAN